MQVFSPGELVELRESGRKGEREERGQESMRDVSKGRPRENDRGGRQGRFGNSSSSPDLSWER